MNQLQFDEAIKRITYHTPTFPQEEFNVIRQNYDKAKPLFYEALAYAYSNPEDLPEEYELHFYALLFFGEFQEKDAFEKIIDFLTLSSDLLDLLLGDFVTDGLTDVLYNTYNGNLELLKNMITNPDICEYVRNDLLNVMGQLFFDGVLPKEDLLHFLKELIDLQESDDTSEICTWIAELIYKCHLVELLPVVRTLYDEGKIDTSVYGRYDTFLDYLFQYDDNGNQDCLCMSPISADQIKTWAMFEQPLKKPSKADMKKLSKILTQSAAPKSAKKAKIGRNDPCPCGSGKKYKFCCLNKPKEESLLPESEEQRKIWLRNYPKVAEPRVEGRIYLEDYFDQESIETDQLIYLALKRNPISMFDINISAEDNDTIRKREYLLEAFSRFKKRMEAEQIPTVSVYDQKYSIHFLCREWMSVLADLLEETKDVKTRNEVLKYCEY